MEEKINCCSIEGCNNAGAIRKGLEVFVKGYCESHYRKNRLYGDPLHDTGYYKMHTKCIVPDCGGKGWIRKGKELFPMGYCTAHYNRFNQYGNATEPFKVCPPGNDVRKHPLYSTWLSLRRRTGDPNHDKYKFYGGRGIKVCDRWLGPEGFLNFAADMGVKPSRKHTLDRIDTNGNYEPQNCRWLDQHGQTANMRSNNETVGVCWYKAYSKWSAYIKIDNKAHHLGYHEFYHDAVKARKDAEKKFGITYQKDLI